MKRVLTEEQKEKQRQAAREHYKNNREAKLEYDKIRRSTPEFKVTRRIYQTSRRNSRDGYTDRFLERVKLRTPDSDLTRVYILSRFSDNCAITGVEFDYDFNHSGFHNPLAPSIDRIDPSVGYYKGNIQIVLACVNKLKGDSTEEELEEVMTRIVKSWSSLCK